MYRISQKITLPSLWFFNSLLLVLGWFLTFWAYPRLPDEIPLWLPFAGQEVMVFPRSRMFFLYPVLQTLFFYFFLSICFRHIQRKEYPLFHGAQGPPHQKRAKNLDREYVLLVLIFFNLIHIHIMRTLILLAHSLVTGVSPFYFYSLFGIILMLIPLFNLRQKALAKEKP